MLDNFSHSKKLWLIIGLAIILYLPSLGQFFSGDDWFHLRVSQISTWREFINFFSLSPTPQSIIFYRPLSTQTFFFIWQSLFGLNPFPYFLFQILLLGINLFLIHKLTISLFKSNSLALLTIFFYGFSVANFSKMYLISTVQETLMLLFCLLATINFVKPKRFVAILFYISALLSKETALVLPLILITINWIRNKKIFSGIALYGLITLGYLALRLFYYPEAGSSYDMDFSVIKMLNTVIWYGLWSIGAPELLVDYVSSGFRPISKFFSDFPFWSYWILGVLFFVITSLTIWLLKTITNRGRKYLLTVLWFLIGLLPVIFLPWHKFTIQLTLPLVGVAWCLSLLVNKNSKLLKWTLVLGWLILNLSMHLLSYMRHYSINRSKISRNVYNYLETNYPNYPNNSYFEFINDTNDFGKDWGSSKQIAHAISRSDMFRVFYKDHLINVYYEDYIDEPRPISMKQIPLSTKMFME